MKDWRTDPAFGMCRDVVGGADLALFSGGPFDVRAVVAGILREPRMGLDLDAVPWGNFPHGHKVRRAVHLLRADGEPGVDATGVLWGLCANGSRAAAALAVSFLIPLAVDAHHPHRAAALAVLSGPARARHHGVASREEFLLHRNDPRRDAPDSHDGYGYEVTGYPAGWSVAAARAAITNDTPALLPLKRSRTAPPDGPPEVELQVDIRWLLERQAEVLPKEPSVHDFSGLVAAVARHRVNAPKLVYTVDAAWRAAALFHEIVSVRPLSTRNAMYGALIAVAYMAASCEAVDAPYGALSDLAQQVRAGRADVYACADQIRRWRL